MKKPNFLCADKISFTAGVALLAALTGCLAEQTNRRTAYQGRPAAQVRTVISYQDDYDYYPGYEVYYSRNRREYVYRDGNTWVRRPEPRGVTVSALFASASVRMEFRDSPEQHHGSVVKSYPKNWKNSDQKHDDKDERKEDKKDDKRDNDRRN